MAENSENFVVVKNSKAKSGVWAHFGLKKFKKDETISSNEAVCHTCGAVVKCSGGTTNLSTHLRRHHPLLVHDNKITTKRFASARSSCSMEYMKTDDGDCGTSCPIVARTPTSNSQLTISNMFGNAKKYLSTSTRAIDITSKIARFIIKDLRPYCIVDSVDFRGLVHTLDPRYQVPSRKQFSDVIIPKMYEEVKVCVQNELAEAEQVALTTDSWTSRATESYMTVTSAHINNDWKLVNYVLQTRALGESHTAERIAEELRATISEWNVPTIMGIPPVVTDNASNVTKACNLLDSTMHVGCLAHSVNLAVQKGLKVKRVSHVLARIRRIVAFFHRSTTAAALLKSKAELLGLPSHKLKIDVSTRWNSAYDMVERYIEMQCAVIAALRSKELGHIKDKDLNILSDEDTSLTEDLIVCLKPFKDITTLLCSESLPTVSVIMPLKHKLLRSLLSPPSSESAAITEIKTVMAADLQGRYINNKELLTVTTLLDPRFKELPYLSDGERLTVFNNLLLQTVKINELGKASAPKDSMCRSTSTSDHALEQSSAIATETSQTPQLPNLPRLDSTRDYDIVLDPVEPTVSSQSPGKPPKPASVLQDLLSDLYVAHVNAKPIPIMVEIEGQLYKNEPAIGLNDDPLQWWKCKEPKIPLIAGLARCLLCVPATSVPSERVFSTAGDIVADERARLKSKNVDMLIFLKKNMK